MGLSSELGLKSPPRHIESFDVSTLFGRQSVGSCVCFMDGEKHHAHYRRFKIKSAPLKHGADDTLMIYEIVGRRLSALKNADEPMPDLILIDGGSAQLNAAARSIGELSLKVEAISLAKKNEEIFALGKSESVKLSKSCPALKLLMQIRDETHRFAISYHRKLRAKTLLEEK
ncbi:MAG: hypothetical protein NTW04_02710 [Elusimicrobia bacterium]|nr:hypothetical protein [Elusimicrobiota bacterium]